MKRIPFLVFASFFCIVLISGCATTSSNISFFEEKKKNDREAIVYVYRLQSMVGSAGSWNVRIDGQFVGSLKQGAYMPLHVFPGEHSIKIGENGPLITGAIVEAIVNNPNTFNVKENETYYIRCQGFTVEFVSKEKAMTELSSMKLDMGANN